MTTAMRRPRYGRPSLGDRAIQTATLPHVVRQAADALAADHGCDRSTVLTDVVCLHYGRPDLMRRLPQQLLFESRCIPTELTDDDRAVGPHMKVRPPRVVADLVEDDVESLGIERCTLLADIICRLLGFPELVRQLDHPKEGLPLAM